MGLAVRNLSLTLQGKSVLRDVSFGVASGEFVSLLGASGAGKSTTLKVIAGIQYPDTGTIEIDGKPMDGVPAHRRRTSIVFQDIRLFPNMTLEENVAFPLRMQGVARQERQSHARELLALVHLEDLGRRNIDEISGGQQQRAALARALASNPHALLLDEPFSGLDESLRDEIRDLVMELHRELGTTTMLVTHDATEALMISDRIVYLVDGVVVQCGTPIALYEHPATAEVASCFGDCTQLTGTVENGLFRAGELRVPLTEQECATCIANDPAVDGPATAVIRHGGVQLMPGHTFKVAGSTYCGDTHLVRIDTGVGILTARSPQAFDRGELVDALIAQHSVFVYPGAYADASHESTAIADAGYRDRGGSV